MTSETDERDPLHVVSTLHLGDGIWADNVVPMERGRLPQDRRLEAQAYEQSPAENHYDA